MKNLIVLFLILSTSVFAQKEVKHEYYINGAIKSTIGYIDGVRNGNCSYYNNDGTLYSSMTYWNGQLEGLLISFYENGLTKNKTLYKNGIKEGLEQRYYENGQLQSEEHYLNGKPTSDFKYFDEKGIQQDSILNGC